jgi:lincosamide nucleotidyltransferase A/C/D/E
MDVLPALAILDALAARSISAWVHGGWGVDALLGEQTRRHDDLDLVVQVSDYLRLVAALGRLGYRLVHGAPPSNFVLLDPAGRQVDVHPVRFSPTGDGIYRMENGEDWAFPAAGFRGRGHIGGQVVRCLTPEVEVLCHAGYEFDEDDWHDLEALQQRFGVAIPTRR